METVCQPAGIRASLEACCSRSDTHKTRTEKRWNKTGAVLFSQALRAALSCGLEPMLKFCGAVLRYA